MPAIARTAAALALCAALLAPAASSAAPAEPAIPAQAAPSPEEALGGIAPAFEANLGQADPRARYLLRAGGTGMFFTPSGVRISLADAGGLSQRWGLQMGFAGATAAPEPTGALPGAVSYFKGSPDEWVAGAPTYEGLTYRGLWEGVDLVFRSGADALKYDLVVAPGADPSHVAMRWRGATSLELLPSGALKISTPAGSIIDEAPVAWQGKGPSRTAVPVRYELRGRTVSFALGDYDHTRPLTIDPAIVYAGYLGGSGTDLESGNDVAVDAAGAAYVAGHTGSTEATFPAAVGPDLTHNGNLDAFVAKVAPGGASLVYAGYIGGSQDDFGTGVAVDASGAAYVTGGAGSSQATFPAVVGPDLIHNGSFDAFVAKVASGGTALVYAGYLGGTGNEQGLGVAVDASGAAYVTGRTESTGVTFPAAVGPDLTYNGGSRDAFVAKVAPGGASLVYAGYIGGSDFDQGTSVAVDTVGAAYVAGWTESTEATFPAAGGPDLTHNGGSDAFVARVAPGGTSLVYAGYIGGSGDDRGWGIAVAGPRGGAYVTGDTSSTEATFSVAGGPDLTYNGGVRDAFVAKVAGGGTSLVYAGYIGGSGGDSGNGVAVDASGAAYVTGSTSSTEASFPAAGGPDFTHNGSTDAFVAKVAPGGTALVHAGYIGGSGFDEGFGVAVDGEGAAYVAGRTSSTEATFPTAGGPDLTHNGGTFDAFVAKVETTETCMGQPVTQFGGPGDDTITGTPGDDVVLAGDGNDTISTGAGDDLVCAGAGNDTVHGDSGDDTLLGGDGNDHLEGGSGRDTVHGDSGDDTLLGGDGNDHLEGGSGRDTALGDSGDDTLLGGEGDDHLEGGSGRDTILGEGGSDDLKGDSDNDKVKGGPGNDRVKGGSGKDKLAGQGGRDRVLGQGGKDLVKGGGGRDKVKGGSGNDKVKGQGGKDRVAGQGGKDKLFGGAGPDKLVGGAGEDVLKGQRGNDNLNGGADTDTCRQQAGKGILRNCER